MLNDNKNLEMIYEKLKYKDFDYLQLINDNFNWDLFFDKYSYIKPFMVNEEYTKIKDIDINNGKHIEYLISSRKNIGDFLCIIDLIKCKHEIEPMREDIVLHDFKKVDSSLPKQILNLLIKYPDNYVCKCQFVNKNKEFNITNQVGNLAFYVLRSVEYCLKNALLPILNTISCIEFHVSKKEQRRIELYKQSIKHNNIDSIFPNEYIDNVTDKDYITYYRFKS